MKLAVRVNPVLARESKVRMRGWRAPALLTLYVGLLGLVVWGIVFVVSQQGGGFAPQMGGEIFGFLATVQFALLCFSAPGLTAGAISGERERQTLDLLLLTRMTPWQVVTGKLGAANGFVLLMMVASLPVYSILFLMGGISLLRIFLTTLVYAVTVLLLGAVGLYFSALFRRTQAAVVAAYGVTLGGMVGLFAASVFTNQVLYRMPGEVPPGWTVIFAWLNPIFGYGAAAGGSVGDITRIYQKLLTTPAAREAIWWKYSLVALGLTVLLLWLTARRIRPLKK